MRQYLISINGLKYATGTPSTYYGLITFEKDGVLSGAITFISKTIGVEIITTINQVEISAYYKSISSEK